MKYIPFSTQLRNCSRIGICKPIVNEDSPHLNHFWCVKYSTRCTSHVCYEERTGQDFESHQIFNEEINEDNK